MANDRMHAETVVLPDSLRIKSRKARVRKSTRSSSECRSPGKTSGGTQAGKMAGGRQRKK